MAWISAQTDYGYFLCGMSLLVLAIFCFRAQSLPERRPAGLPLAALGGFALCHALHEWFQLALEFWSGLPLLAALPGALLLASCICLMEFGRRLGAPPSSLKSWCWRLYAPLLALCALATGWGLNFQASTGLFLTLPAALLSLRGVLRLWARQEPRQRRPLLGLGAVIALQPLGPGVWSALLELLAPDLVPAPLRGGAQLALHLAQGGVALLAALSVWAHSGSDRRRRLHGALFLVAITSIMAGGWALTCFLGGVADRQIKRETYARTSTIVTFLEHTLSDVDRAALALSSSEAAAAALLSRRPADLERATLELERFRRSLNLPACLLLNRSGTVVACSDALTPRRSLLGNSFAFRPYFQGALAGRQSRYFAVGKLTGERLYFSGAPVLGAGGQVIGVAVGMRGVDAVETEFRKYPGVSLVSPDGVVFISGQKGSLFRPLWPLPGRRLAALASSGQFGPLSPAPLLGLKPANGSFVEWQGEKFYARRMPVGTEGWSVFFFQPAALVSAYRIFGIAVTCTVGLLALCCFVMLVAHHEARLSAEQLRVSAERLALAAEGANEAVWEWDMALDRGHLNQRFFELAGCQHPPEQCDYRFFLSTVHPEDRALVAERVREHIEGESPRYLAQYRMVSRSGQVRDVMGRGRIVRRAPDGTPLTMAGVILDVTEQKRLADEVNRIRNLESVGILAGGLSHDFNNVLNVICGNVSFARMLARDQEVAAALGDAERGCQRALELGRRLQVLARGGHPVREPVALVEIARASAEAVFKEDAARWRLSAVHDLHRVEADPRQMRQVFESLLLNARDALGAGGAVTVEIGNEEVGADSPLPVKAGSFVRATIRDDGKGIPPEDLQRVFDPYFSTKDSYHEKGMGLGLPICHAVIKRHQGHISVDSVMGRGTSVAVYLPAAA